MNPGAIEEGAKAAGTFMTVMKDQPLSLALVVMNVALVSMVWWITSRQTELRQHDLERTHSTLACLGEAVTRRLTAPAWRSWPALTTTSPKCPRIRPTRISGLRIFSERTHGAFHLSWETAVLFRAASIIRLRTLSVPRMAMLLFWLGLS